MKHIPTLLFALLLCTLAAAAEEPSKPSSIRLPQIKPVDPPKPSPPPGIINRLTGDNLYVIDSDVPLIVLSSPLGLVRVASEVGPLKIRGRFVDGEGKIETRTFKGKSVSVVEAAGKGDVELLIIPEGVKSEGEILRVRLAVDSGTPDPPKPPPDVDPPQPPGKRLIDREGLHVLIVYEEMEVSKLPPGQRAILGAKEVRDWLRAKCAADPSVGGDGKGWYMLDKDQDPTQLAKHWQDALKRPRTAVPWVIVSGGKNGSFEGPLPATVPEMMILLKKWGGE